MPFDPHTIHLFIPLLLAYTTRSTLGPLANHHRHQQLDYAIRSCCPTTRLSRFFMRVSKSPRSAYYIPPFTGALPTVKSSPFPRHSIFNAFSRAFMRLCKLIQVRCTIILSLLFTPSQHRPPPSFDVLMSYTFVFVVNACTTQTRTTPCGGKTRGYTNLPSSARSRAVSVRPTLLSPTTSTTTTLLFPFHYSLNFHTWPFIPVHMQVLSWVDGRKLRTEMPVR